jgi:hypothetical protein
MAKREVDDDLVVGSSMQLEVSYGGIDLSRHIQDIEYKAMLNGGELFRVITRNPERTIMRQVIEDYFNNSRAKDEVPKIKFKWSWDKLEDGPKWTEVQEMAVVSMEPYDENVENPKTEIIAVDVPSYNLAGGGASGEVFEGKVKQVLEKVIKKYGRGVTPDIKSETTDSETNIWHMNRMDPQTFILSLLEWSSVATEKKTEWFVYPDQDKMIIVQQADMKSKHRSTYDFRGLGGDASQPAQILNHQGLGDSILRMYRHNVITSGISATSGAYYDKITDEDKDIVHVGDKQTSNKFKAEVSSPNTFKRPSADWKPPDNFVGWTYAPSIPENSAGDVGIKYKKYIDGVARDTYLKLNNMLNRCRFRIYGHHIWTGSEGLGVDTIKIIVESKIGEEDQMKDHYWMHGTWIVYGYHHFVTRSTWYTDLYCARLDTDADAKSVK